MPRCTHENCYREVDIYEKNLTQSTKCIFHCKKDDWYDKKENNFKDWSKSDKKREYYFSQLHIIIDIYDKKDFHNIKSPERLPSLLERYNFRDFIFPYFYNDFFDKSNLNFNEELVLNKDIYFENCTFLGDAIFQNIIFNKVVSFNSIFTDTEVKLSNCEFKNLVAIDSGENSKCSFSFYNSKFEEEVRIENSKINVLDLFSCDFNGLLNFNGTSIKKANFEDAKLKGFNSFKNANFIKGLDFENTIITGELKLKGLKGKIKNRETARIIKNSFEQQNNIIEANKFYALEMKEREKELKWGKDFFDKLIFSFHGWSSNHSQDWLLALFWIINITFITSFVGITVNDKTPILHFIDRTLFLALSITITGVVLFNVRKYIGNWSLFLISGFMYWMHVNLTDNYSLDNIANCINPFSVMNNWDDISFNELIFKIIIAYLIYQLIISIRQNTRRK